MKIGNKISLCRKQAGMSQEALANELKISRQAVSRWETGEAVPDTEKIIQLSRLFHISTDYLLLDERETPEKPEAEPASLTAARRGERQISLGKILLFTGLISLISTLFGAGFYAYTLMRDDRWYSAFGNILLRTWLIFPLVLSGCLVVKGVAVLWKEYHREN